MHARANTHKPGPDADSAAGASTRQAKEWGGMKIALLIFSSL